MTPTGSYRQLSYEPSVEVDRLGQTAQNGLTPINPTLARRMIRPGLFELFFHANSKLTAWDGGRDVSIQYKLLRLRRHWTAQLSGSTSNAIATGYVLESGASGPRGFGSDGSSWIDTPGQKISRSKPTNFRSLDEFIVGVGEPAKDRSPVPEFGGLYFIVAVDITPDKYKIWMSLERRLTSDQIQGAVGVPGRSFPNETIRGGPPDFASWRYVPHSWEDYPKFVR